MADFESFSEGLKTEVLAEMADTYFGARRDLDMMLEHFDQLTDRLAAMAWSVERHAGLLHFLLLEERGVPEFYQTLGVAPREVSYLGYKGPVASLNLPLALGPRGRWLKCVRRAYRNYQELAKDYMHGHLEADPKNPKRKRTTLHFHMLKSLSERINKAIQHVNRDLRLNDALDYAKGLEPGTRERERMAGGGQYHESRQDADLDFVPIELEGLTLKPMPDLPEPGEAWRLARRWLKGFHRVHREEIAGRMKALARHGGHLPPGELVHFRGPGKN